MNSPLLDAIAASAIAKMSVLSDQDLTNTAWAFATLHVDNLPLFDAISASAIRNISEIGPQGLANTAWALATIVLRNNPLMEAIASAAIAILAEFSTQELSNTAWSFSSRDLCNRPLLDSISSAAIRLISDGAGETQDFSNTAWAFSTLNLRDKPLLESLACASILKMTAFGVQGLSNISWAFATRVMQHRPFLNAISAASIPRISDFRAQEISNTAWSFATLALHDAPLRESFSAEAIRKLHSFKTQDMTNTAWSCATLSICNITLMDSIASSAISMITELSTSSLSPSEAFDFCFSLVSFSWSFAFIGTNWTSGDGSDSWMASWARGVSRSLLQGILAIGKDLDHRAMSGESDISAGGVLSWVSKVAPAAQGGYAYVSKSVGPPRVKSPSVRQGSPARDAQLGFERGVESKDVVVAPTVVAMPRGMIVVSKPVNWEVDGLTSEGGGLLLSSFVQALLPRSVSALVHTMELDYGFIHRLDVPSSGLILGGTTFEGLFHLKWQIAVYSIDRQYFTTNHGLLHSSYMDIDARIDATTVETMRSVTDDAGKPARTHLGLLAHLDFRQFCGETLHFGRPAVPTVGGLCILVINIHTGRRHQIRAHTRHVGHPCVTDARYTPRDVFVRGVSPQPHELLGLDL